MKQIREAVGWAKAEVELLYGYDDVLNKNTKEMLNILIDLAEKVLAVKMPEKKYSCKTCDGIGWWAEQVSENEQEQRKCPDCEMGETLEDKGWNDCLNRYTSSITGALLSESDILNIFNHYFNKMEAKHSKAIMDGDWGTNGSWFTNAGEMFNELAKQIHSAQMEKLGGE